MKVHNNQPFSTKDRDNDGGGSRNCAELRHGAFWYKNCYAANLNGEYLRNDTGEVDVAAIYNSSDLDYRRGIVWFDWKGWKYSLKRVEMKIKPN